MPLKLKKKKKIVIDKTKSKADADGEPVNWKEGDPTWEQRLQHFDESPLFIGFSTEPRPDLAQFKPLFVSTAVKEETRLKQSEEFDQLFATEAKNTPYLGQIKQIIVTGPTGRPDQVYKLMPNADVVYDINNKTTPSMTTGHKFSMWSQALFQGTAKVRLVGFDIRTFAKMAAYEAAETDMPLVNTDVWFAADYYDTEHVMIPRTPAHWQQLVELRTAITRLCSGYMPPEFIAKYTPGKYIAVDAMLSMYVCCKLRLFDHAFQEGGLGWQQAGEMLANEVARSQRRFTSKGKDDGPRT